MYQVDLTKSAQQNLIALINSESTVVFTGTEFDVSAPVTHTPTPPETTNTTFTMTAREGSGYRGIQEPRYTRLALGNTRPGLFLSWNVKTGDSFNQLKDDLLHNHNVLASDIDWSGITDIPDAGQSGVLTITAKEGSYFFTGSVNITIYNTSA